MDLQVIKIGREIEIWRLAHTNHLLWVTNQAFLQKASQYKVIYLKVSLPSQTFSMKRGSCIFSVKFTRTIHDVVRVLKEKSIGALVISNDQGVALGVLSERDIVRRMAETRVQTLPQLVGDLMTCNVETCTPQDSILDVLNRMSKGRFRHMPVITDGRLGRIITIGDLVQFWLQELEYEALQMRQMIVG
jgi:signal-transduction protein with cAMP-binding, CBS, and nucleotidyltransferase domain